MDDDEWAEEAGDFFTEFAKNAPASKSARRINRETEELERERLQSAKKVNQAHTAEEFRNKIRSAVLKNASEKEIKQAKKKFKSKGVEGKKKPTTTANEVPQVGNFSKKHNSAKLERQNRKNAKRAANGRAKPKFGKKRR
ncbi:hypothetical protein ADEAN_000416500 [Angomonas deanei]|uniref:Uncharacterized protein n=1 Tax=Angomonas deanei TaxID=59799 RepID=A0A7G2CDB9_9TRYP|nr:hypothetical protein ADEAN_000416500 [Angomonas deanei]